MCFLFNPFRNNLDHRLIVIMKCDECSMRLYRACDAALLLLSNSDDNWNMREVQTLPAEDSAM